MSPMLRALPLILAMPAMAQDLAELPEDQPLPPGVAITLKASLQPDDLLDRVRRWQGDLVGDAMPDQIVQAAIATGGGNAVYLRHWIFQASDQGFLPVQMLDLPSGIISARRDGGDLVLQLYKYLPDDPRCCPSGQEEMRLPLD
jgi:hypothetical protein